MLEPHKILGVNPAASPEEIQTAFEQQWNHWQKIQSNPEQSAKAKQKLAELEDAYEQTLSQTESVVGGLVFDDNLSSTPSGDVDIDSCPSCNYKKNPDDARFCIACQTQLFQLCAKCDKEIAWHQQVCHYCGINIEEYVIQQEREEEERRRKEAEELKQKRIAEEAEHEQKRRGRIEAKYTKITDLHNQIRLAQEVSTPFFFPDHDESDAANAHKQLLSEAGGIKYIPGLLLMVTVIGFIIAQFLGDLIREEISYPSYRQAINTTSCPKAIPLFTEAIEWYDSDPRYYIGRAKCYSELNQPQKTLEDTIKAIQINPSYGDAYAWKADAHLNLGQYDEAMSSAQHALELNSDPASWTYYLLGMAFRNNNSDDKAIKYFTESINAQTFDPLRVVSLAWVYYNRGLVYAERNQHENAIADFTYAISRHGAKYDYKPYAERAISYQAIGQQDKANEDLQEAYSLGYEEEN